MSREAFRFRGNRHGLSLSIADDADFRDAVVQLRGRLDSSRDFFQGAVVHLAEGSRALNSHEKREIQRTVEEFGMVLQSFATESREKPAANPLLPEEENTLLVRRTIRSGQKIHYAGNVVILGDVNPGAEVVCAGDILVLGALRGMAHAGCKGQTDAVVLAFRLEPTQLRIGQYISRAPDEKVPHPQGPELAKVVDNMIQISAYA